MNIPDLDHLAPDQEWRYVSTGFLCQLLQIVPGQLATLMEAAEVRFALVLDGVGYLMVRDAEAVAAKVRDIRNEIAEVSESAESN